MALILILAAIGGAVLVNGFVISQLWLWFIVSTFGMEPISIPAAIGLSIFIAYIGPTPDNTNQTTDEAFANLAVLLIGKPLLFLLMGYIVTYWM